MTTTHPLPNILIQSIVCCSTDGVIGINGEIPWNIPEDLKHFYNKTKDSVVIVGRKTFDTLPERVRSTGNRLWVVVSKQHNHWQKDNIECAGSTQEVLQVAHKLCREHQRSVISIAGGASIYETLTPYAHQQDVTMIDTTRNQLIDAYKRRNPGEEIEEVSEYPLQAHYHLCIASSVVLAQDSYTGFTYTLRRGVYSNINPAPCYLN